MLGYVGVGGAEEGEFGRGEGARGWGVLGGVEFPLARTGEDCGGWWDRSGWSERRGGGGGGEGSVGGGAEEALFLREGEAAEGCAGEGRG